ncbi:KilA-like protein [Tolypothrix sp. NIES-4075]|uniref:KilA-N domain-containing protein n=1 Tax=Tolypothrix sp. NIES-4075 TaxID=2005459 RepID=UPI000B5CBE1D|nr:KilA-N domain-containing protein [Tolypothrix sp. NIES-4075]GAX45337.1 KilA-like protein [Tolypothrix sp. NIES-4075]
MNKLAVIAHNINDSVVEQRQSDGYINATALSKAYKLATQHRRDVSEWLSNKRTQETLEHLSSKTGITVIELYQAFQGSPETGGGTWIHPNQQSGERSHFLRARWRRAPRRGESPSHITHIQHQ